MDRTLIQKLSIVSLKANQLSNAYLVIRAPLLIYIFFICPSRNYCSTSYDLIVANPWMVETNPLTIGEFVFA